MSSLIGLASVQAPPPNGVGLGLGDEAPGHRLVEPARGGGAAHAALERLRRASRSAARRRRRAAAATRRRSRRARAMRTTSSTRSAGPSMSRRQLGAVTVPVRRRPRSRGRSRIARLLVLGDRDAAEALRPAPDRRRSCARSAGGVPGADDLATASPPQISRISRGQRSRARRRGRPDRRRARSGCARRWSGRAPAPVARDPLGIEIGDLEQHVGGRLGARPNARRP